MFYNSFQESLSFGGQIEEKECCIKDVDHIPDGIDDAQIEDMAAAVYIQSSWDNCFILACTPTLSEDIHCAPL